MTNDPCKRRKPAEKDDFDLSSREDLEILLRDWVRLFGDDWVEVPEGDDE